jgi:hypothetical protein
MFSQADLEAAGLPEPLHSAIAAVMQRRDADPAASLSRPECQGLFGHKQSKQIALEASGELVTFVDGGKKRIEKHSAYDRLIRLLIESASSTKIREVPTRFKRKVRPRTPAELRGLEMANERRREEGKARRAQKAKETADTAA